MDEDESRARTATPGLPRPLTGLSVEELNRYLADLRLEIGRVEAEIEKRQSVRGAAEALFKRPTS